MSRSYKKNLVDKYGYRWAKAAANRRVRRYKGYIQGGGFYRKLYPQWDIHDMIVRWDKSDLRSHATDDWWWNYAFHRDAPGFSNDEELYRACWHIRSK